VSNDKLPNIFLIIMDSARKDYFGCYGSKENLTPNFDKLANDSLVCENFYSGGAGTAQSHGTIFLGQHSTKSGLVHNLSEIGKDIYPFTSLLKEYGYSNYGHSKIVVPPAGSEVLFSFDEMIYPIKGNKSSGVSLKKRLLDYVRRFPRIWNFIRIVYRKIFGAEYLLSSTANHVDGKESLDYLLKKAKNTETPNFLFTTIMHPHTPYYPPVWARKRLFGNSKISQKAYEIQTDFHSWINGNHGECIDGIKDMNKLYKAELLYGDSLLGGFIDQLKEDDLYDDSIIIVTSDHGEFFGEHGNLNHGVTIFNEIFKLPCLVKTPENIHKRLNNLTTHVDIYPTLLDLLSIDAIDNVNLDLDGHSILKPDNIRSLVIDSPPIVLPGRLSHYPKVVEKYSLFYRGLINKNYKYIWRSDNKRFLYRRDDFESEENNIFETHASEAEDMHKEMMIFYSSICKDFNIDLYPINIGPTAASMMTSPRIQKELKKLGYL
jgi:arylsulfatase A-like enzyme